MSRLAPILLFVLLAVSLGVSLNAPKPEPKARVVNLPAITLSPLDGKGAPVPFTPASEPVLLNFFASWCVPCLAEHPHLKQLQKAGLRIEGVAWNDKPDAARAWLDKHGNPFARVWSDPRGEGAIALGLRGVPESFLILPDGRIRLRIQGALTPELVKELLALVKQEQADAQ